ncbi:MAG: dUTP diphosphatase [Enterococcus aquimarinus]|uniref:dUTP diphosphatase n=1 Tax=Enterococcus aquimarinus TaxID=328396 RepID=A0A9E3ZU77_9ENTE|nr:dUTP diphosphatase [Enterococcus aquimarinus]
MNFKKLQQMQAKLDEAILADKAPMTAEERFNKTLVALSVEIAEVANCAEHFKFWKDNKGKVDRDKFSVIHYGNTDNEYYQHGISCIYSFEQAHRLTLIEECSDALHFILSLANQADFEINGMEFLLKDGYFSKEDEYRNLQALINYYKITDNYQWIRAVIESFCCYTSNLGVEFKELEQAYYDKNKINYERLENGY